MFLSLLTVTLYFAIAPPTAPLAHYAVLPDKVNHVLAFGLLGASAGYGFRTPSFATLLTWLSALGVAIEVTQQLTPFHRTADVLDWVASTAGAGAGLLFVLPMARAARGRAFAAEPTRRQV
jgi:VanZ family protein